MQLKGNVVLYHGTDGAKLKEILSNGLVPSRRGHTKGLIFLTTNLEEAEEYARQGGEAVGCRVKEHNPVVLKVSLPLHWIIKEWKNNNVWSPFLHPKYWKWDREDIDNFNKLGVIEISKRIPAKYLEVM